MKVLITGVAGLLGSKFAQHIIDSKENVQVIGIDNLSGGYLENIHEKVIFHELDLAHDSPSDLFSNYKFDYVFHLAAYAAEGLSPFIRKFNYDNNLRATASIVNECVKHNVERLIFTSSMAVYGHGQNKVFDETQIPNPIDPYGVAKYACELDIKIAGDQHDLDWTILRPHNVYGPNQNIWDKYRNVLGIWMYQQLNKKPMTIYGDGKQTRAFSFINDCLEPMWKSAINDNCSKEIINLGGIESNSIIEANDILKTVIGKGKTIFLESRHEVNHAVPTFKKSVDLLGYKHLTSLKSGLAEMWNWAKKQPERKQFIWPRYELEKGIYSYWKS